MKLRGEEKWQKILWKDTPIIMNDGQQTSLYVHLPLIQLNCIAGILTTLAL